MSRGADDRREIARQLFSRRPASAPPAEPEPPGCTAPRGGPIVVCCPDPVSGLSLAGAVAAELSARHRGPWYPRPVSEAAAPAEPGGPREVLAAPHRDGPGLRRAALGSRLAVVWSGTPAAADPAEGLVLALTLAHEAGLAGPILLSAARALPPCLEAWLGTAGSRSRASIGWAGVWRPGLGLPPELAGELTRALRGAGMSEKRDT